MTLADHQGMTIFLPKWLRTGFKLASSANSWKSGRPPAGSQKAMASASSELGKTIKNVDLIKHLLVLLRRRKPSAGVSFKHVKAHMGWAGNEAADVG